MRISSLSLKKSMGYKVVLMPQAESDLEEAFLYIFERAPDAARLWYKQIKTEILGLSKMPGRCPEAWEAEKLGIPLRQLSFGKRTGVYRVIFLIMEKRREVHILAVRHAARKSIDLADL